MHEYKLVLLLSLAAAALAAYEDERYYRTPPPPRILSHQQAQDHDGGFKFAFAAENGLAQMEVIAPDGTRNGGYTYVDPHGKTISVKYAAGKDGFRILEGEHIPREVHAHPNDRPANVPHHEHDDGSYKPERDEHPYSNPARGQQQGHRAPVAAQYQPQFVNAPYIPKHAPPPPPPPQPRYYGPPAALPEHERYSNTNSNALDLDDAKQPVYHDSPGKPHSFGVGYAFHIQN